MPVALGAAAMQYSSLPAEVEAAVHVARRRCAVDGPPTASKPGLLLSTGVAWTTGWLEDVEAACPEGLWSGTLGSALPPWRDAPRNHSSSTS